MSSSSLPLAEDLLTGALDNGLKYYIWDHAEQRGYCELRLFVAVGSWCESDAESGLAHFVEHMAFKTTTRFSEQGSVIRFLETKGAQYGHDLNASTGLLETVYKFQIPIRSLDDLTDGLSVLAEWAFAIRATEEDVESEKPIICEEWRTKRGARERLKAKYWQKAVSARVAERFPIGDLQVIKTATPAQVQSFYRNWYRPGLMGVAVVGDLADIMPSKVSAVIQRVFGGRTAVESSPLPPPPPLPQPGVVTCFLQDAEVTACTVSLELLQMFPTSPDVTHLEREVARRLFLTIMERRFSLLLRAGAGAVSCPAGILDLAVASSLLLPTLLCTSFTATVATDETTEARLHEALTLLVQELCRVAVHGVARGEIARAASAWASAFSPDRPVTASELVDDCLQHFRFQGQVPLAGPRAEATACREFLANIDKVVEHVNSMAATFDPRSSGMAWRVCVQCGPGPELDMDALWAAASAAVSTKSVAPWVDMGGSGEELLAARQVELEALVPQSLNSSEVVSQRLDSIDAVEFTLPNGIVACCIRRPTPGRVAFQAFALGGSTELDEFDECAMGVLDDMVLAAGLSDQLDGAALAELQSVAQTRVNTQRHLYHRGIGGSTTSGQFSLLLRLVAARFLLPKSRFASDGAANAAARTRSRLAEDIKQRSQGPHFLLGQRARILSCGGNDIPVLRPVGSDAVDSLTTDRCSELHARGFAGSPANFTFVFVGDLPPDTELARMLTGLLGHLKGGKDPWLSTDQALPTPLPLDFCTGIARETIYSKTAEKATVLMILHVTVPMEDSGSSHFDAILAIHAACRCAQDRLLEILRREAGCVYTVSVTFGRNSLSPHGHITVSFDCDPKWHESLLEGAISELRKLQDTGPSAEEAANVSSALAETHARNLGGTSANSYWLFYVLDAYKGERLRCAKTANPSAPLDSSAVEASAWTASHGRTALISSVSTPERLQSTFRSHFNLDNYVHLVLEPDTSPTTVRHDGKDVDVPLAKKMKT